MIKFIEAKKNYIMALAVFFVIVSLSGTTYSLFIKTDTTDKFDYTTGLLDLAFTEDTPLTLNETFHVADSEGSSSTPYTLTIKNTGNLTYRFDLKMLTTNNESIIDNKYIKVKVNDNIGWPYKTQGITLDRWYGVPVTLETNVKELYKEVFKKEDYTPSESVQTISEKIIKKTGYK